METLTLIISLIGALAWLPTIFETIRKRKLSGKMISRYNNFNSNDTFFLFKLNIFSKNKDLYLKDVFCEIEFEDGITYKGIASNMRLVIFNGNEKLKILGTNFINNLSVLPKNTGVEGYLYFSYNFVRKEQIKNTKFEFITFENKKYILDFKESDINSKTLFYDDSIWEKI
jgi:hypothetical protein